MWEYLGSRHIDAMVVKATCLKIKQIISADCVE